MRREFTKASACLPSSWARKYVGTMTARMMRMSATAAQRDGFLILEPSQL